MAYNHYQYGDRLARQLVSISHSDTDQKFFTAYGLEDLPEIGEQLSAITGTILIAVDGKEATLSHNGSDGYNHFPTYGFIVARSTASDDKSTIRQAADHSEEIIMQIVLRLLEDNGTHHWNIDTSKFEINGIGPIADNFYGVVLSFSLVDHLNTRLNPDLWH